MVWRRIFHHEPDPEKGQQDDRTTPERPPAHSAQPSANPPSGEDTSPRIPLHMQQALSKRQRTGTSDPHARLAALRRRREAAIFDLEQGELALQDDNPWKQRSALLTEALETVQQDRAETEQVTPGPFHPLPPTPVSHCTIRFEHDVATVTFSINGHEFRYEEPLDWAERGTQVVRSDLAKTDGSVDALIPQGMPAELHELLRVHLELSLFVFATELRERTLNQEPIPDNVALADFAPPCPVCGGWTDYLGRCQTCARRNAQIQQLDRERNRLLTDRAAEFEEERRMAERLPVARRRLHDIDTEIESIEQALKESD